MKLLSLALAPHDANISYFDGNKVRYYKFERGLGLKHYGSASMWEWKREIKNVWNITEEDIDELIFILPVGDDELDKFQSSSDNSLIKKIQDVVPASTLDIILKDKSKAWYMDHHYAHSLSGWMLYDDEPDINIVIDGLGDRKTWSVFKGNVRIDSGDLSTGSLGYLMMDVGKMLKIKSEHPVDYAGKVMGLQSYGHLDIKFLKKLDKFDIHSLNEMFDFNFWLKHKNDDLLGSLSPLDWIKTVHHKVEHVLVDFFKKHANKNDKIFYSGGVAQNVIWNTALRKEFDNLIIVPHCADDGLSLGGLEWLRRKNNLPKFSIDNFPYIQSDECVETPSLETIQHAAKLLSQGKTVAWYQGNGEIGPRALGNRSILMDPRIQNGKLKINSIKQRENYRPFGASALREYCNDYFDVQFDDEYMLYVTNVKSKDLDSITHIDNTCRLQTVNESTNKSFYLLLKEFYDLTGCPVVLNTSLNLNGKPICGRVGEAEEFFLMSTVDCLFVGNKFYSKF